MSPSRDFVLVFAFILCFLSAAPPFLIGWANLTGCSWRLFVPHAVMTMHDFSTAPSLHTSLDVVSVALSNITEDVSQREIGDALEFCFNSTVEFSIGNYGYRKTSVHENSTVSMKNSWDVPYILLNELSQLIPLTPFKEDYAKVLKDQTSEQCNTAGNCISTEHLLRVAGDTASRVRLPTWVNLLASISTFIVCATLCVLLCQRVFMSETYCILQFAPALIALSAQIWSIYKEWSVASAFKDIQMYLGLSLVRAVSWSTLGGNLNIAVFALQITLLVGTVAVSLMVLSYQTEYKD